MHNKRHWRKSIWLALTTVTAASILLTGCGASKSPPPGQIPASDQEAAGAQSVQTQPGTHPAPPDAALLPAPADGGGTSDGSGGSGNPTGAGAGELDQRAASILPAEAEPGDDEFLLVADFSSLSPAVQRWHDAKREYEGAFEMTDDGQAYLLISAGAMPTGGYSLTLRSLTETSSGWGLEIELHRPSPNAMVTQVVTYPSLFFTAPPGDVKVILYEGNQSRELRLNEGGGDAR